MPIEALQPGDLVLAVPDGDPLGTPQFMPITAVYHNQSTELLTVAFTDGSTISLTAAHEVYTATGGWGLVEDVRPGDVMLDKQGDLRIVDRVERAYAPVRTYNLTVAGSHTFFADGVWVHNCGNLIPDRLKDVLNHIRSNNGSPPKGYKGGGVFENLDGKLPPGKYRKYDTDPKPGAGQGRNSERIVIDEKSGAVYYSPDHYGSFIQVQ